MFSGPSGHGKSLLARKCEYITSILSRHILLNALLAVGSLLDVPTHTVNMTVLNSTQDLWRSYSMSPHEVRHACYHRNFPYPSLLDAHDMHACGVSH